MVVFLAWLAYRAWRVAQGMEPAAFRREP